MSHTGQVNPGTRSSGAASFRDLVKKVVAHHDLTGIVVGVTLLETRVVCEDRIRD